MRVTLISITPLNKHFHESTNWNKYSIFLHQCWRKDYLLEFRSTRIGNKTEESNIKMNDIATVLDENQNRNKWRLGKIEKLVAGKGGIIRGKDAEQNKKPTVIIEPLQKLFYLEWKRMRKDLPLIQEWKKLTKQMMNYQSRSRKIRRKRTMIQQWCIILKISKKLDGDEKCEWSVKM